MTTSPLDEVDEIWQPRSGCGWHCVNDDEPGPKVGLALKIGRMTALVAVMLVAAASLLVFPVLTAARRARLARRLAYWILGALGVRLELRGTPPERRGLGSLVVMNHVSWLDIVVLLAAGRSRIVAKTEVGSWPVVGQVARFVGTIFVDRSRPLTLPATVTQVRDALLAGDTVSVFPEGTTSCGRTVRRFRPAFFQAAVEAGAPIVPVTLRYHQPGSGRTSAAAFIGEDNLMNSLGRIVGLRNLVISACYGSVIYPGPGATRRSLADMAATAVGASAPAVHRLTSRAPVPRPGSAGAPPADGSAPTIAPPVAAFARP